MTALQKWEDNFDRLDQCPWPGPRPLRDDEEDTRRCVGREREASDLVLMVKQHRLVILSGDSGVGKSSLVNVKLLSALRSAGYTPIVCKKWSKEDPSDKDDEQAFIRRKIVESIKERGSAVPIDDSGDLARDLDDAFAGLAVIVFDQFEELIRYQPELFSRVAEWIISTNKTSRIRIVLSLRSEHRHRLRDIEQRASPFSFNSFVLEPVSNIEHIKQLVENSGAGGADERPISKGAVDVILKHWQSRSKVSSGKWHGIGLLHLQATLYSLHALAKAAGDSMVNEAHIDQFLKEGSKEDDPEAASKSFFEHGLREAVQRKLFLCEQACTAPSLNLDRTLVEGTKAAAYRMIPHLSSGGYKLEREAWDLAELALDRELEQLVRNQQESPTESGARLLYRELASLRRTNVEGKDDLLTISRHGVLKRIPSIGISVPARSEAWITGFDVAPWDNDPTDASAGPMLGFQRGEVLIEEVRRVVFAQHWLEAAQIIRTSSPEPDRTMLSLTHDGFADALEYWARVRTPAPSDALYMLTAAKGRTFDWLQEDPRAVHAELDGMPARSGDPEHVTLVNLRWQDCRVSASFRWVAFVNCDFTGTRFRRCRFEGVSFINCLLDKASFEECEIVGAARHVEPDTSTEVRQGTPSFKVQADRSKVSELQRYRWDGSLGETSDAAHIFSRTSGISAMPWDERYRFSNEFHREKGGLTMYGGRLSSLMIRACKFVDNGQLGLRFIAGSALDIVETSGCNLDIVSAAIRGLTITREVEPSGSSEPDVKVQVTDSWFNNCWFGDGLEGRAVFDYCLILQLFNLSNSNAFKVEIKNSNNDGVRNVAIAGQPENRRDPNWMATEAERKKVAESVLKMDYRNQAARMELGSRRK